MLIMAIRPQGRLSRAFFGSLAREVAVRVNRTVLFVHGKPGCCAAESPPPE
jgi:nucleotide-binding universal stress UspA family protein